MKARDLLIYLSLKYEGSWDRIIAAIKAREKPDFDEAQKMVDAVTCKTVTILDTDYPEAWKAIPKPPICVYYHGDLSIIEDSRKCLSYVGSRHASPYGRKMAQRFAGEAASKGYAIVSGMAIGIDTAATKAALEAGGKAVAVLGSGIDVPYPSSNKDLYEELKKVGLVLSEYPSLTPPGRDRFPERNRLIAGTSQYLIVGEAGKHSGTFITVGFALEMNKDVGAVPFEAGTDSGCNLLIKEGADMIDEMEDLYCLIGYKPPKQSA